jgi:hypothetical protein
MLFLLSSICEGRQDCFGIEQCAWRSFAEVPGPTDRPTDMNAMFVSCYAAVGGLLYLYLSPR